ncbi:hypothetical protein QQ045_027211 [Rhodiola kirilowii]
MPVHSCSAGAFTFFLIYYLTISISCTFLGLAVNSPGEALLSWKATLNNGMSIQALENWNPVDGTPCKWFGITCNQNNEVVELELKDVDLLGMVPVNFTSLLSLNKLVLSGTNLTGSINKEIGMLAELYHLDLSDNALSGVIPDELCNLSKLRELYLNSNGLVGAIPKQIGKLTSLAWLVLYDNQLSGEIPSSIGNLKSLEVIRAGGNKNLDGPLPQEIGNCSNLVMLGLAETSLSGSLPQTLGMLKKLETLAIYTALLSGPIPPEIGECTKLENIYLYENSLTGSIPSSLGKLKNLQNLLLWQNNLVGVIPPEIGNCNLLQVIDFSMNSITGSIPSSVGNLTLLQELQLSVNQISGEIPTQIGNCKCLTHIELDNNQITGAIPEEIGLLGNLSLLFLWQNKLEGEMLHDEKSAGLIEWDTRLNIAVGVAEGMAYLHHGCVPAILHRDVKAHNILLGDRFEPCLADFGLARFVEDDTDARSFSAKPQLAGSYGYMAPDPSFPEGQHLIQWVRDHLKSKKDPVEVLDPVLQGHPDTQVQEMLQALGISLLCTSNRANDRPTMKDVAVLLREIRHERLSEGEMQKPARSKDRGRSDDGNLQSSSSSLGAARMLMQQGSSQHSVSSYSPNSSVSNLQ